MNIRNRHVNRRSRFGHSFGWNNGVQIHSSYGIDTVSIAKVRYVKINHVYTNMSNGLNPRKDRVRVY